MNAASPAKKTAIVVMGVAGCGKTTVGQILAQRLGWSFAEADDFHSAANVAKMGLRHAAHRRGPAPPGSSPSGTGSTPPQAMQ